MADIAKIVEEIASLTLLEASELKKALEDKLGVQASVGMPMGMMMGGAAAPAAAAAAEPVEEQTEFTVILQDAGPNKINVIKVVRALTNLGLKEAKDAVEGAPTTILDQVNKQASEDAKKQLEEAGAKVTIK